jgi:hypothetical protein
MLGLLGAPAGLDFVEFWRIMFKLSAIAERLGARSGADVS